AVCLVLAMCLLVCGSREQKTIMCILNRWVPVIICSALMLIIASSSSVEQWASEIGENIHDKLHSARYDTEYTTLPEGDFSNYTEYDGGSQTALVVSMEQPEEMYLRGFTAAEFSKENWSPLNTQTLAESEELLHWMNSNGRNPQMQFDQAAALISNNKESEEKTLKKVTVQNLNACSEYMYVPYSLSSEECLTAENISPDGLSGEGSRMYTYSVIPEGSGEIGKILKKLKNSDNEKVKEYRQAENAYRQFIYKYYLDIPEETMAQMTPYWEMISSSENKDKMTTAQAQNYARAFLEECFPEHGERPELELPLETVKDSSYQYATVAVLTLRYYGIPARYAEGYIITEEMADSMDKNGSIQLDEGCSGAWAEVYQDGIGWLPMDMTAGLEEENSGVDPDAEDGDKPQEIPPKGTMKLDDMDDMTEEPDPDGGYVVSIKKVISFTVFIIIAVILLLVAALAVRRHILLKRRTTRWSNENINDAVAWIFADTEYLLKKLGFDRNGGSMTELISSVEEILGSDYTRSFEGMISINSRAVFSSHKLDEEHRETAKAFYSYTLEHLKSDAKWHKRLWMQWVLCLY
ncbi:MAG: transglutaminase domain-containing protein, partial [Firmicutes bacterium]|nr:transglutaminase domain-containing protein [Bacillota bacterium]